MPIYVVDDNPDISDFLAFMLSGVGYRVHAFTHPEKALLHMQQKAITPSMLITDYHMPSMNGFELHEQVSQHAPDVKTIVISGRGTDYRKSNLHFLNKPFQPDQLIQLVKTLRPETKET